MVHHHKISMFSPILNKPHFSDKIPNPVIQSTVNKGVGVRTQLSFFNRVLSNRLSKFAFSKIMDFHPHKFCYVPTYSNLLDYRPVRSDVYCEFWEIPVLTSRDDSFFFRIGHLVYSPIFHKFKISISHLYELF